MPSGDIDGGGIFRWRFYLISALFMPDKAIAGKHIDIIATYLIIQAL
jgi:hypothetical protein